MAGIQSPWAILLVRFKDDTSPLPTLTKYQRLFTSAGRGTLNLVDYFDEMSHGKIDISGTKVFGWYTLDYNRADYIGGEDAPVGKLSRPGLLEAGKSIARNAHVDLSKFAGVVVCSLGQVDLCGWIGGMAMLCDSFSLNVSVIGHEMAHGYGLDHSMEHGSIDHYRDPWDTMSNMNSYVAANTDHEFIGPGLNAWNMRTLGWLDETRVWKDESNDYRRTFRIRPLHSRHLSGFLALQVKNYLIEFRIKEKWDAGIPEACVLIHRTVGNRSYIMPGNNGNYDLKEGDKFSIGVDIPNLGYTEIEVLGIDTIGKTATLSIFSRPMELPLYHEDRIILGGIRVGGGGGYIINGKYFPIPPESPWLSILESIQKHEELQNHTIGMDAVISLRKKLLADIIQKVGFLQEKTTFTDETPPKPIKIGKEGQ